MSKQTDAEAMWSSLRDALANVEEAIKKIVAAKAWKPLGFETFAEAWDARMGGVALANSIKPYVIYAMLDESLTLDDIASITGWGIDQVSRAAEDYKIGVPVEGATVVRQHVRRSPGEERSVHLLFEPDELFWLKEVAKSQGRNLRREARKAVIARFEEIEAQAQERRVS